MAQMQAAAPRSQAPSALPVARSGGGISSDMRAVSRPSPPASLPDDGSVRGAAGERFFRHADPDLRFCCAGPPMSRGLDRVGYPALL